MKKTINFLIMLTLLCSLVLATSPQPPMVVRGDVYSNGQPLSGIHVEVENERTGEILDYHDIISLTTENGIYVFLANDFKLGFGPKTDYYPGDPITIRVGVVETTEYLGYFPYIVEPLEVTWYVPPPDDDEEEEVVVDSGTSNIDESYISIDAFYGDTIDLCVGNSKISKLLNEEVRFDGTNYDISEEMCVKAQVQTSLNNKDFGLNPYLYIEEASYSYIFEDLIPIDDISEDETLSITLLGKEVEISRASANEITLISGEEYFIEEKGYVEVEGKKVVVNLISNGKVALTVDGVYESFEEGDSEEVNGLEIRADDIMSNSDGLGTVNLRIGLDVESVIEDGDDYKYGDFVWEWVISLDSSPQFIGVINQEEFKYLDDDVKPLSVGDTISLPEGYLNLQLSSVTNPEVTEIELRYRDGYLLVEGDFNYGTDEYDEVYVNSVGIYDRDYELISSDSIQIGDSDINLELGSVIIGDLEIELDLSDILHKGSSYATKDEDFLDYLGIIFKDAESAVEDKRNFKVYVPEERPEVTIKLGTNFSVKKAVDCPEVEECPECKPEIIQNVCPDPIVCPEVEECPTEEDKDNMVAFIIGGIVSILFAIVGVVAGGYKWFPGMKGISNYYIKEGLAHLRKGEYTQAKSKLEQAFKTMKTIAEKAKEEKYEG